MDLSIQKLSKVYGRKVVFNELTFSIPSGTRFAIRGPNGSGKSTLLKILSGGLLPTGGHIQYTHQGYTISSEEVFRYIHFVAPYNTVIEELSLREVFRLHQSLGLLLGFTSFQAWFERLEYAFNADRQIKTYSSGMKQRIKLGLALLDDRPLILLDEPGSNLDAEGKAWFFRLTEHITTDQTLVIASNEPAEIEICMHSIGVGRDE